MPDFLPEEENKLVRVIRDRETGVVVGFQDPDTGRFISRADALPRLRYSVEKSQIIDSFGNDVGVGAIGTPRSGNVVQFKVKEAEYTPLTTDPAAFRPNQNQEVVERTIFITPEGKLVSSETSYGLGTRYKPETAGGRWRKEAAEALKVDPNKRLPTKDLKRAVARQEYLVKTIR